MEQNASYVVGEAKGIDEGRSEIIRFVRDLKCDNCECYENLKSKIPEITIGHCSEHEEIVSRPCTVHTELKKLYEEVE